MRPIDADALKEEVWKAFPHFLERLQMAPVFALIREAPTIDAEPEQKWIPVSERLPRATKDYLCWVINPHDTKLQYYMICTYYVGTKQWCPIDETASANVVAWFPFPDPWKGAQNKND